jgi:hypothetical protein
MDIKNIEKTIKNIEDKKDLSDVDKELLNKLKSKLTNKTIEK